MLFPFSKLEVFGEATKSRDERTALMVLPHKVGVDPFASASAVGVERRRRRRWP